jgi:hypothetical protein
MRTDRETVLTVWCRLTGQEAAELDAADRAAFLASPQLPELAIAPYPQLLDAGIAAAGRGSLPLDRWILCLRALEPVGRQGAAVQG